MPPTSKKRGAPSPSTKGRVGRSTPKTTRPVARSRRERDTDESAAKSLRRRLDAHPDRIDIRDWFYQPSLAPLPDQVVNVDSVPEVLDQENEGACCGFALAAVVNFLLRARNIERRVSPRMLYEMARRYDEWPSEDYEGSSARGTMKGWMAHGVCDFDTWPPALHGAHHLTPPIGREAQRTPGGAFFRIQHRQIRDMHAALNEVGILFCTLMVHDGWGALDSKHGVDISYVEHGNVREIRLPVIRRHGEADSGHAVAIVGYTHDGFIIQNSWGPKWGAGGFALLPYEDYMLNATDVWVAQLGVPVKLSIWRHLELEVEAPTVEVSGLQQAARAVPLSEIRPYTMDVGTNGELSTSGKYWTTEEDLERLFTHSIPEAAGGWQKARLMLYLHGGLNDETTVARRIVAFRDVLLKDEIYPVHIMWESGIMESLNAMIRDLFTDADERKGAIFDWLKKVREGGMEVKDRTFELTAAAPGRALWREMKENARLASQHPERRGGMQLLVKHAHAALKRISKARRDSLELHVVAHSAGSIFAAYAMRHLVNLGINFKSLHLMAPAITVELFKKEIMPFVKSGKCPHPSLYILSDVGERDDDVGPYGKSLLYLVSNAFEGARETPLVGMERFVSDAGQDGARYMDAELGRFFKKKTGGFPSLVVAGEGAGPLSTSRSDTHGGFDNDEWTLNSILRRVLAPAEPSRIFTLRDLQY
ncbi:MAG TPA: C1 family peptidase [Pyrinomonadaceae bacterium]|nr:C1 family peptidase [Pyrinomonadaceae bacterium]